MRYLTARSRFLRECGPMDHQDRMDAIALYDKTLEAKMAIFLDEVEGFLESVIAYFTFWK